MEEFENESTKSVKTDYLNKNIAGFIDGVIIIILYCISLFSNILFFRNSTDNIKILFIFTTFIFYRLISIVTIKRTIGMILLGIKFSKENGSELNLKEKLLATIMVYVNNVDCFNTK